MGLQLNPGPGSTPGQGLQRSGGLTASVQMSGVHAIALGVAVLVASGCGRPAEPCEPLVLPAGQPGLPGPLDQEAVVAHLSGERPVGGGHLENRYDPRSRRAAAGYVAEVIGSLGLQARAHNYDVRYGDDDQQYCGVNVYASVPATEGGAGGHVVVGAHYDSRARGAGDRRNERAGPMPGANDNATGVALVLAVAEAALRMPTRSRPLVVVALDQEEVGLVGARAFADKLRADGTPVHSVHTVDQVGWDGDGDRVVEVERPSPMLEALYRSASDATGVPVRVTDVGSTDHVAFRAAGYEAVGVTEEFDGGDTTPHYHQPTDTADTVDYEFLASATRLVWDAVGRALAGADPTGAQGPGTAGDRRPTPLAGGRRASAGPRARGARP